MVIAEQRQQMINDLNQKMEIDLHKGSSELANQLEDIRALKYFLKKTRENRAQ